MAPASSLEHILAVAGGDRHVARWIQRELASSHQEFLDILFQDLLFAVERLEQNPQLMVDEGEDQTTQRLADMLAAFGYQATHNTQAGGNVDLTVERVRLSHRWIAEAKRFGDVGDMREGYLQLSTRYRPALASDGRLHGGMIGYLRRPNAAKCMTGWREHLAELIEGCATQDCSRRGPLGFVSSHAHGDYGVPLEVWHVCVVLHFDPQDASGRTAKRYRTT